MAAYYNENDPKTAAWLRELIKAGLIADGEVDTRSIVEVHPSDLTGFVQCHFFAGIGGWSYALRLAGWPDERHVWTGSCPCQPFSAAGKGAGANDSRDLWPTWFQLIAECRPVVCFGEQVASADGLGWLDRVSVDLEAAGYALGAVDLGAPFVSAFHLRQRLWFVADTNHGGSQERWTGSVGTPSRGPANDLRPSTPERGNAGALDNTKRQRAERIAGRQGCQECPSPGAGENERRRVIQTLNTGAARHLGHANGSGCQARHGQPIGARSRSGQSSDSSTHGGMADADGGQSRDGGLQPSRQYGQRSTNGAVNWQDAEWIACTDGKARPVEPGTFPLAYGVPARVGRLRGYGNAIVPPLAAEFIKAYCDARGI